MYSHPHMMRGMVAQVARQKIIRTMQNIERRMMVVVGMQSSMMVVGMPRSHIQATNHRDDKDQNRIDWVP